MCRKDKQRLTLLFVFADHIVYKKVGDGVVLKPDSVPDPITSITWGDGSNLAIVWEKSDTDITYYRHFKGMLSLV